MQAALTAIEAELATGNPAVVSVVGGGCAGVELAACVAERLGSGARVQLLTPSGEIMPVRLPFCAGGPPATVLCVLLWALLMPSSSNHKEIRGHL